MTERLRVLACHLTGISHPGSFQFAAGATGLDEYRKKGAAFNADVLRQVLDGQVADYRKGLLERSAQLPLLTNQIYHDASRADMREIIVKQIAAYVKVLPFTYEDDQTDLRKLPMYCTNLCSINQGLAVRLSVHLLLYAEAIRCLGSEKHIPMVQRAFTFQDYGCFCMTELGHGTNVAGVETTATYDLAAREFILDSPTPTSAKWWIGALAKTANMAVVFAQLILQGKNVGVHCFLVPIRSYDTHQPLPGITIGDCGPKMGLHGIDNGFCLFKQYRVPYDALLDRFSHLSADGKLKATIKNKDKRFAAMLSAFTRARTSVCLGGLISLRHALTTAVRYAAVRRQFGKPGSATESSILDYPLHRYRLMPHLANLFACNSGVETVLTLIDRHKAAMVESPDGPESGELHAILSIMKTLCSWYSQRGVQECRESLAGHGYSSFSNLGTLLTDNDVNSTWEGDNNVLLQQTSRFVFRNLQKLMKGQRIESEYLSFLSLDLSHVYESKAQFTDKPQLRGNLLLMKQFLDHRTRLLVAKSVSKLQENGGKFGDAVETWNQTQVFFLHPLALAFGEKICVDEFVKTVEVTKAKCAQTGEMLSRMCELYVLSKVVNDLGTFRDHDYLTYTQAQTIKDYVLDLCNELAESSVRIIDAVAYPDQLHGSVFGVRNGDIYKCYTDLVEKSSGCYDPPTWVGLIKELRKSFA